MRLFTDIYAPIIGRVLMGGFFLWDGIQKSLYFTDTAGSLAQTGIPLPIVTVALFITLEVLGGIALIVGLWSRAVALILALFTVATSLLYINFSSDFSITIFLQSMAIVGGLLYISSFGSGSWDASGPSKRR